MTLRDRLPIELLRWALVLVFLGFGYVKFFAFEAKGVAPLIAAHPALSWAGALGEAGASAFLGVSELLTALLLALGVRFGWAGVAGGALAMVTFAVTVTLFFFLPGVWEASAGGFPAISGTGGFLLKDVVLFAAGYVLFADGRSRLATAQGDLG